MRTGTAKRTTGVNARERVSAMWVIDVVCIPEASDNAVHTSSVPWRKETRKNGVNVTLRNLP
jgi:hypothetical protein